MQKITLLGSSGSIGQSTLCVLRKHPEKFRLFAIAANSNVASILEQCREFTPEYAVLHEESAAEVARAALQQAGIATQVLSGEQGLCDIASAKGVDTVIAAIVGAAGLPSTLSAIEAGKKVLLANKEALVMSGALFDAAARQSGARILPVDSEHNAIFQCLPEGQSLAEAGVSKIILTASGGPFRTRPIDTLAAASPEEACAHPNWDMGKKISVDSATMMNKGLEFIEACCLFDARPEQIDVLIHPQSIVHSMVAYRDGSVIAQLGQPDMRTPLAYCLGWPERIDSGVQPLDFTQLAKLEFSAPDYQRFPCLGLAMQAVKQGGDAPTALNAANEIAVEAFLGGEIPFTAIALLIEKVMDSWEISEPKSLQAVIDADLKARDMAIAVRRQLLKDKKTTNYSTQRVS